MTLELAGMSIPTEEEIKKIIADGAKCPRCQKNPAELTMILDIYAVGPCHDCQELGWKEGKERKRREENSMGSNNVQSVWVHEESGALIPVNEKGNVVHSPNMKSVRQTKGKKPVEF